MAYVFWHVPRAGTAPREYEAAHGAFHDALRAARIPGLLGVRVFRLAAIPWLGGQAGYEDWHLLEDSSSLDVLDHAAVNEARLQPHDRIAALAGAGTAGLYSLRQGAVESPAVAYWLSKPAGMNYAAFGQTMAPLAAAGCALWGRRMTLGPTPEFCLQAPAARTPPHAALAVTLEQVSHWSGASS